MHARPAVAGQSREMHGQAQETIGAEGGELRDGEREVGPSNHDAMLPRCGIHTTRAPLRSASDPHPTTAATDAGR
jgi:hypothetical protein